ncbi:uncharacterized protein DNG_00889 [Cephalotrichum gorgonifer]|uniref:Protein kinase domain-containing protein n=1 Tax=Cephalotrichum gorgonifer TaxID=2041049 RepID=A0AAE8SRN0_9PEZI|nr:uncharacterized protein DNG_00889 [Cephalotrichum gorgonifer]
MELTPLIVDVLSRPVCLFEHEHVRQYLDTAGLPVEWEDSSLNPKNLPNSLKAIPGHRGWRVDGMTMNGRRLFAIPPIPDAIPLRIDAYILDSDLPSGLRKSLDVSAATVRRHPQHLSSLGLPQFVCQVLDEYTKRTPAFLHEYARLPFGSQLHMRELGQNPQAVGISVVRNDEAERLAKPMSALQQSWGDRVPPHKFPTKVDIMHLRLVRQLHDTVSLVQIPHLYGSSKWIFKSNTTEFDHLYHELEFLLTCPPHPHILGAPRHVVERRSRFGGKRGIVGFIVPYLPTGTLRDTLPLPLSHGGLSTKVKLAISKQVLSALIHVHGEGHTFHSEFRLDNILLTRSRSGGLEAVLCDFEHRENWYEWCPPEVLYPQYLEHLRQSFVGAGNREWKDLVEGWNGLRESWKRPPDDDRVAASNLPWFRLSRDQAERAQVYTYGLFLYAVFEGLSNVRVSLWDEHPAEPLADFPEMRNAPLVIQEIIYRCTIDAPEREQYDPPTDSGVQGPSRLVRVGGYFTMGGSSGRNGSQARMANSTAHEILDESVEWWSGQVRDAWRFVNSDEARYGGLAKSLLLYCLALTLVISCVFVYTRVDPSLTFDWSSDDRGPPKWEKMRDRKVADDIAKIPPDWILDTEAREGVHLQRSIAGEYIESFLDNETLAITSWDVPELVERTTNASISAQDVVTAFSKRAAIAHQLNKSFLEINFDNALTRAKELDAYFQKRGKPIGPLHGLPVTLKDQYHVKGLNTTMGYVGWIDTFEGDKNSPLKGNTESEIVRELESLGAVIIGKFGETRNNILGYNFNPVNQRLSSGGSSGGEGAIQALGGSAIGVASDVGGSISMPASYNGVYSIKPSANRLSFKNVANSGKRTFLPFRASWVIPSLRYVFYSSPSSPRSLGYMIRKYCPFHGGRKSVVQWQPPKHGKADSLHDAIVNADGNYDVPVQLALSGEPFIPELSDSFVNNSASEPLNAICIEKLVQRLWAFRNEYNDYWVSTAALSGTGRPVDALLMPAYASIANTLDYVTIVIPVTFADKTLDQLDPDYKPVRPVDKKNWEAYDPEAYHGAPAGIQIVGRRLEEEKLLAIAQRVVDALAEFREKQAYEYEPGSRNGGRIELVK